MLLFCQQYSFLIVLHLCHGSLSSSWLPKPTPRPLCRGAQHRAALKAKSSGMSGKESQRQANKRSKPPPRVTAASPRPSRQRAPAPPRPLRLPGPRLLARPRLAASPLKARGPARPAPPFRASQRRPGMEGESTSAVLSGFVLGALSFQHLNTDSDTVSRGAGRDAASPRKRPSPAPLPGSPPASSQLQHGPHPSVLCLPPLLGGVRCASQPLSLF